MKKHYEEGCIKVRCGSLMNEEWRELTDYPGYEVSSLGRVRRKDKTYRLSNGKTRLLKGKIISQQKDREGYVRATLRKGNERKQVMVQRLVASAFLGDGNGREINHINFLRCDNRVENLEWTSHSENCRWSSRYGAYKSQPIIGISKHDGRCIKFFSLNDAKRHGFSKLHVVQCCKGERASHHGYTFQYAE